MTNMINTLRKYVDRMRVLHLSLPGPLLEQFGNNENPVAKTDKTILEKLFIEVRGDPTISPRDPEFAYQCDLAGWNPSPTHLSFRKINYLNIGIRWDNVTSLETPGLSQFDALEILKLTPKLQIFKSSIESEYGRTGAAQVAHRSLRMLCLTSDETDKFLDFITCPVMDELSYRLTSKTRPSLSNFLRRSACLLKRLSLET